VDWKHLLFSYRGRVNRAKYWLAAVLTIIFMVVIGSAAMAVMPSPVGMVIAGIALLVPIYVGLAIGAKRLHDREISAWWLAVFYLVPGVLDGIGAKVGSEGMAFVLSLGGLAISIWAFVVLGCLRGTIGPNRYGPDPLEVRA